MSDEYTFRPARQSDKQELADLWEALLQEQSDLAPEVTAADDARERWENDFPSWLHDDTTRVLTAEVLSKVVGYVHAEITYSPPIYVARTSVFIREIFVKQSHRRKGIAASLIEEIKSWALNEGIDQIRLSTLYQNKVARQFWESIGATPRTLTYAVEIGSSPRENKPERKSTIGF